VVTENFFVSKSYLEKKTLLLSKRPSRLLFVQHFLNAQCRRFEQKQALRGDTHGAVLTCTAGAPWRSCTGRCRTDRRRRGRASRTAASRWIGRSRVWVASVARRSRRTAWRRSTPRGRRRPSDRTCCEKTTVVQVT